MNKMGKMLAVTALAGGLLFSGTTASAASFKDLKNFWGENEIQFLVDQKIVKGDNKGFFQPNKPITKAQGAIIIATALNLKPSKNSNIEFSDVSKKHAAYKEIAAVVEAGIFPKGKKFNPNEPMSRELTAQVIVNAFDLERTDNSDVEFKDVPKSSDSYEAIQILVDHDITTASKNGKFNPNKKVTRAEFSIFMARAISSDFLPTQYNIPGNVNPVFNLFNIITKQPKKVAGLFATKNDFGFTSLSKYIDDVKLVELTEIARKDGITEFYAKVDVDLDGSKRGLLKDGENELYFLIKRVGYMEYRITSVDTTPHLESDDSIFTNKEALSLFGDANKAFWYVVRGGDGKRNEKTFTQNGVEYRYMAESLNTEAKVKSYLGKYYTPEQVTKIYKDLGFITKDGRLAQPNADGGSILNWSKATISQTSNSTTVKKYEMKVPLGDTRDVEVMQGELRFVEGKGWRVYNVQSKSSEDSTAISKEEARQLFHSASGAYWYVVSGGDGKRNEKTFNYKGTEYRFMAESLDTEEKLKTYLGKYYTPEQVSKIYKDLRFITKDGKLAQPNADGGSLENFGKATLTEIYSTTTVRKYEMKVPLDGINEYSLMQGELRYVDGKGWRVHNVEDIVKEDDFYISKEQARSLFADAKKAYWTVVSGGEGKRKLETFTYKGIEYRYMAESLNTEEKLKNYLGRYYTPEQVSKLVKDFGYITKDGILAQPNADGGSILNFEKATMTETYSSSTVKKYEMKVPLGFDDTKDYEMMLGEIHYVDGKGWRVHNVENKVKNNDPASITKEVARTLFAESKKAYWYVVSGGEGKRKQETFTYKGIEYRYMAESLNTEERLKKYLGQYYTPEQVTRLYKDLGFITKDGVLAQPNADGGSILNFEKATLKETFSATGVIKYELNVPSGDSKDVEVMQGELRYVDSDGWRVHSLEQKVKEDKTSITTKEALSLFEEATNAYWYVVRGGDYSGKIETFNYKGKEYRYMTKSLDSEEKVKTYLGKYYTPEGVNEIYKDLGFITKGGKIAQPNADGGSILNWKKATIKEDDSSKTTKEYELRVPLGDTKDVEKLEGKLMFVEGKGWRVHEIKED